LKLVGAVSELWRYPVVGLQGESLLRAKIIETGISGDRAFQLRGEGGKILGPVPQSTSTTERSLLGLGAAIDESGGGGVLKVAFQDEIASFDRPDFSRKLSRAVGVPVRLEESSVLATRVKRGRAVHVISNASIRALRKSYPEGDFDVRRFRPNIVLDLGKDAKDFAEESWVGKSLRAGEAVLKVEKPNERCTVTTLPQGNLPEDKRILQTIVDANGRNLGVMCSVEKTGAIAVGDSVFVV
jgi:MOSC domain-containing protein